MGVGFPMLAEVEGCCLGRRCLRVRRARRQPDRLSVFDCDGAGFGGLRTAPAPSCRPSILIRCCDGCRLQASALVAVAVASTLVEESITTLQQGASALATSQAPGGKPGAALAFDPKMAIYARQRGIASLLLSEPAAAIADLQLATALNPNDDFRWRGLPPLRRGRRTMGPQLARAWIARLPSSGLTSRACSFPPPGTSRTTTLRRTSARRLRSSLGWPTVVAAPGSRAGRR